MYSDSRQGSSLSVAESLYWSWKSSEEQLVDWWLAQSERQTALQTSRGEQIVVIHAGTKNDGPGPDVLNCHLCIDDLELAGPVEMHEQAADWFGHHHHLDPKYEQVILHVVRDTRGGPAIPTLRISAETVGGFCIATRPAGGIELHYLALDRLRKKVEHLQHLAENRAGYHPLLLGLLEVLLAGPQRSRQLHQLALSLGMNAWPHERDWPGSRQQFPVAMPIAFLQNDLLELAQITRPENWELPHDLTWKNWNSRFQPLRAAGLSLNQCREWVVNVLVPYQGNAEAYRRWCSLKTFRHYGYERTMKIRLGLTEIRTIAEQQAVLEWRLRLCREWRCSFCPLVHTHQTLT